MGAYLPRIRSINVEGLTIDELSSLLEQKFENFVINPMVYVRPLSYRPIRVYVGGEIANPGFYTLTGREIIEDQNPFDSVNTEEYYTYYRFPTLFDALRIAKGITPYSNLENVSLTKKYPWATVMV